MRTAIKFLLGDHVHEVAPHAPTTTLLDYLRLKLRQTGTKEGCAEGDCGACTVVVGRLVQGRLVYEAVNSCIRFLPMLDGCHIITIEQLQNDDGTLHPLQTKMVTHHASQCGFCTPGIVMSLLALWLNNAHATRAQIIDALAGNLCRCTGYGSIIAAMEALYAQGAREHDKFLRAKAHIDVQLKYLDDGDALSFSFDTTPTLTQQYFAPRDEAEFAQIYADHPEAVLLAGTTDVGLWVTKDLQQPKTLIALHRVRGFDTVSENDTTLSFGPMVNLARVHEHLAKLHPDLGEVMRRFGSAQIRNCGTIGGNIANGSPIGDLPPVLMALGATLTLRKHEGARTIALDDFFIAYRQQNRERREYVAGIEVNKPKPNALVHVSKISKRFDEDISSVCAAFYLERDAHGIISLARLAFGGMAGTPKRAAHAEAALIGKPFSLNAIEEARATLEQDFAPLSDWRASSAYRMSVAKNLLLRFYHEQDYGSSLRVVAPLREVHHA